MKKLYIWAREKVTSPYGTVIFTFCMFIEAVFFMPVNTLLLIYGIEAPKRAFKYATIAVAASLLGSLLGYSVGYTLRSLDLEKWLFIFVSPERFEKFNVWFVRNKIVTIFIGAVIPFPFKAVTIPAGFFNLPLLPYLASVFAARMVRFFSLATALYIWGERLQRVVDRYFYLFLAIILMSIGISIWYFYF